MVYGALGVPEFAADSIYSQQQRDSLARPEVSEGFSDENVILLDLLKKSLRSSGKHTPILDKRRIDRRHPGTNESLCLRKHKLLEAWKLLEACALRESALAKGRKGTRPRDRGGPIGGHSPDARRAAEGRGGRAVG